MFIRYYSEIEVLIKAYQIYGKIFFLSTFCLYLPKNDNLYLFHCFCQDTAN